MIFTNNDICWAASYFLCTGACLYALYSLLLISNKFWWGGGGGVWNITIYAPMIYSAPCEMFLMRAASITWASGRGLGPGNRESLCPKWQSPIGSIPLHRAQKLSISGAQPLTTCPNNGCSQWWAEMLKNVSFKAIQIHNFWEKNRIKRYNFFGQNFCHRWSDTNF